MVSCWLNNPSHSTVVVTALGGLGAVWWVVGVDDFVAGAGFDNNPAAVVDVVMAVGAGETHFVDVG